MNYLPQDTVLGPLSFIEVYDFYDVPCSFSARSAAGQTYVAVLTKMDEQTLRWVYLPLSEERLRQVHNANLLLRDAFRAPESGYLFRVSFHFQKDAFEVTAVAAPDLADSELPASDAVVRGRTELSTHLTSAAHAANALGSDVLDLVFAPGVPGYRAKAAAMGASLQVFQKLYNALHSRLNNAAVSSTLLFTEAFPGSFGVRLSFDEGADLFNDTAHAPLVKHLFRLLEAKGNTDELRQLLVPLKPRALKTYRNLIQVFKENGAAMDFRWGRPKQAKEVTVHYAVADLNALYDALSAFMEDSIEEVTVRARLIGLNVRTRRFELWSLDENEKISGHTVEPIPESISKATISNVYTASLLFIEKGQEVSDERQREIVLQDLTE